VNYDKKESLPYTCVDLRNVTDVAVIFTLCQE